MEKLKENVSLLYEEMEKNIKLFKKETYEDNFLEYRQKNSVFLLETARLLDEAKEEDRTGLMERITDVVTDCASGLLEAAGGRIARENKQLNLNMVTVLYVIPAFRELKSDYIKEFTEILCVRWDKTFKGNRIQASDAASIQAGFRSKLCYVTTAVCKSLNKPDDCYELQLLRSYRDGCLCATQEGARLVREYYNIAPTIVKRINKSGNAEAKYLQIWENYLRPCIRLIEERREEECRALYTQMVEKLHKEYMEEYNG